MMLHCHPVMLSRLVLLVLLIFPFVISAQDNQIGSSGATGALDDRPQLSGMIQTRDTPHFRLHYTTTGIDAVSLPFLDAVAEALENAYTVEVLELGWAAPPLASGVDLYEVFIGDLVGTGEGALGFAHSDPVLGDNPNTAAIERRSATGYLAIDNDYDGAGGNAAEMRELLIATIAHELHHLIQFGYDGDDSHYWIYEATAVWMEGMVFRRLDATSGYLINNFEYPEICLGTSNDEATGGLLMYGEWLFLQSWVEVHGTDIIRTLWEDIAQEEGFAAMATTLARYGDDIPASVARYRIRNLLRAYESIQYSLPEITVYLENTISDVGEWSHRTDGVQELAANYYELALLPGIYTFRLMGGIGLQMVVVGVQGDKAVSIPIGEGGAADLSLFDYAYLMVTNPAFDEDVDSCYSTSYSIDVKAGGSPIEPVDQWNADNFIPPV